MRHPRRVPYYGESYLERSLKTLPDLDSVDFDLFILEQPDRTRTRVGTERDLPTHLHSLARNRYADIPEHLVRAFEAMYDTGLVDHAPHGNIAALKAAIDTISTFTPGNEQAFYPSPLFDHRDNEYGGPFAPTTSTVFDVALRYVDSGRLDEFRAQFSHTPDREGVQVANEAARLLDSVGREFPRRYFATRDLESCQLQLANHPDPSKALF